MPLPTRFRIRAVEQAQHEETVHLDELASGTGQSRQIRREADMHRRRRKLVDQLGDPLVRAPWQRDQNLVHLVVPDQLHQLIKPAE